MNVRAEAQQATEQDPRWLRTWFWPAWLLVLSLSFAIAEGIALAGRGRGGTLSERTREWLGLHEGDKDIRVGWVVLTVVLGLFAVWFPAHLMEWWPWEG